MLGKLFGKSLFGSKNEPTVLDYALKAMEAGDGSGMVAAGRSLLVMAEKNSYLLEPAVLVLKRALDDKEAWLPALEGLARGLSLAKKGSVVCRDILTALDAELLKIGPDELYFSVAAKISDSVEKNTDIPASLLDGCCARAKWAGGGVVAVELCRPIIEGARTSSAFMTGLIEFVLGELAAEKEARGYGPFVLRCYELAGAKGADLEPLIIRLFKEQFDKEPDEKARVCMLKRAFLRPMSGLALAPIAAEEIRNAASTLEDKKLRCSLLEIMAESPLYRQTERQEAASRLVEVAGELEPMDSAYMLARVPRLDVATPALIERAAQVLGKRMRAVESPTTQYMACKDVVYNGYEKSVEPLLDVVGAVMLENSMKEEDKKVRIDQLLSIAGDFTLDRPIGREAMALAKKTMEGLSFLHRREVFANVCEFHLREDVQGEWEILKQAHEKEESVVHTRPEQKDIASFVGKVKGLGRT